MRPLATTSAALLTAALIAALTASPGVAQCPFAGAGVAVTGYGQGCNPAFGGFQLPTVAADIDAAACELTIAVDAFGGCCNTFLIGNVLAIGFQPLSVPLPVPGCAVLVDPAVVVALPTSGAAAVTIPLLAALPPLTLYAQPVGLYFTTIGLGYDLAFGAGAQLDLQ